MRIRLRIGGGRRSGGVGWCGLSLLLLLPLVALPTGAEEVNFNQQIRPILLKNCFACHGPDPSSRQANTRLDTRAGATGADGSHKAIIPGDNANSRVAIRVAHPEKPMPPSGERLRSAEIELIKRWIDQGADYDTHWSFEPPMRHELPAVKRAAWPRNEIDYFVLENLEKEGLAPSPEADRYTLIRRIYLDLIGLPPAPKQVAAFVNDDAPDAYEKVVDKLFNSAHHGERWARVWLDLARYADSKGYEADRLRTIWPYRDWVIRALNANMPFDRFTIVQLAGDLLPVPTRDQLIATGFHRNTMTNDEGGTDNEEFRDLAVKDRVATTGQVWMGLTWGCAQCHTHKYDPLSHQEFYQLYAFFNQTADADKVSDKPKLKLDEETATLIMQELPPEERRKTFVHQRGNFMDRGEEVEPTVPAAFHPFPENAPRNRHGLAKWLVDKRNPLTARVVVNRFWARFFGAGIVETEEDFGNQGSPPSHPKLLDWLATEFMRLDWDMKGIQKKMVMSATYRQSSETSPALIERDRFNRLLARGPRVRLPAETVRDQMLAVSGLLSDKMYGEPVMPLQPDGVWQVVYSGNRWETSEGQDRYRRAIYTMWRRTSPYPALMTFDAPTGEVCTLRRVRTSTPLQALVTLNDPLALEAAQHLAKRVLEQDGSLNDRIERLFRLCLARPPKEDEVRRLRQLYEKASRKLRAEGLAAQQLLHVNRIIYEIDRRITLQPTSRGNPQPWRYTAKAPGEGWELPDFDDSSWSEGEPIFGRIKKREDDDELGEKDERVVRTPWSAKQIWLRRVVQISDPASLEEFRLLVEYRGNYEIYINGVLATHPPDAASGREEIKLEESAERVIVPGRNVIAARARQTLAGEGDQYIDVGLRALHKPDLGEARRADAQQAAWVVVAHVLLNLDETLTKR